MLSEPEDASHETCARPGRRVRNFDRELRVFLARARLEYLEPLDAHVRARGSRNRPDQWP